MRSYLTLLWFGIILLVCPACQCFPAVLVFDRVSLVNKPVYLKALTKGKFFPEGGKRITFSVDNKIVGKTLSGGDGYAYLKYVPIKSGLQTIKVNTDEGTGKGSILVLGRHHRLIGIEIVGGLRDSLLSPSPLKGSLSALNILSKGYAIVYLAKPLTTAYLKKWLKKENFPASVTLAWTGGDMLPDLTDRGIVFYAVIGSAQLVAETSNEIEKRYTFEGTDGPNTVSEWNDILNLLKGEK